jgi:micrococcal nuclease
MMSLTKPTSIADRPAFSHPAYIYRAEVKKIVDADTIDVLIDLGFGIHATKRLRFLLIDTWEVRGEEREQGLIAKDRLTQLIDDAEKVYVQTIMDAEGKYGRVLAWVWTENQDLLLSVNEILLDEGHGTVYGS